MAPTAHWRLTWFAAIAAFTLLGEQTAVPVGSMFVSGSFLGMMLAAVSLGGTPAAALGAITICAGWLHSREGGHWFRTNLATYIWFPLLTGAAFHAATSLTHASPTALGFYLFVCAAFVLGLFLNFLGIAGYGCYVHRTSLRAKVREAFAPVLSAELASALLTVAAAYVVYHLGTVGLILFGIVLVVFQYLVGELLTSKRRSDALHRIATTDELTNLANREHFRAEVERRIGAAREAGGRFAVLLMDLDRFKEINDTLGHHYGDVLLSELGPRLVSSIGERGLVARLGGDEFAILLPDGSDDRDVLDGIIGRLTDSVNEPFTVDEMSLEVGVSVGVARFPVDGEDSHALLRCADIAMYSAKETQTGYKIYSAEQNQHSVRRLGVLSGIRHALASDEIVVHFQPIVDLDNLQVRGAEGLVRWQHPEHGLIPPGAFVQTVEQTGLIGPLTRHVLERSIHECAVWRRSGRELSVAVNLSVRNLLDPDLPREISRLLDTYGLPADALQLEITESMIMSDPDRALATVGRLSDLGVRLSVDDFGTGYSSLANLRKMPIDELKIDRSFVSPMLQDESDLIIVRSTINLGHDLGLRIIAEGVEDNDTLHRLASLGCDLAQGYHVSRPMAADAFTDWLHQTPAHHAAPGLSPDGAPALTPAVPPSLARGAVDLAGTIVSAPEV
ncbi:MAG: EAL domain-containing protein [Solirubrobacteraceae bacterium]